MSKKSELFRLPDGTIAYLEMHTVAQILADKGLDPNGSAQMFHTHNVLGRLKRYMPFNTGMTYKVTAAQTDIKKPQIITDVPYGQYLYHGKSKTGKALQYNRSKNKQVGPFWDKTLKAAEGAAMAADLQQHMRRK